MEWADLSSPLVALAGGYACLLLYGAIRLFLDSGNERPEEGGEHPPGPLFRASSDGFTLEVVPLSSGYTDTLDHLKRTDPTARSMTNLSRSWPVLEFGDE
jgi:hypothetical protein